MTEKIVVITLGLLVLANFAAAIALTIDWRRVGQRWTRTRRFYAVHWQRMDDADRKFWTWYGRAAWVCVLAWVGML